MSMQMIRCAPTANFTRRCQFQQHTSDSFPTAGLTDPPSRRIGYTLRHCPHKPHLHASVAPRANSPASLSTCTSPHHRARQDGSTGLIRALMNGHVEAVRLLLDSRADPNLAGEVQLPPSPPERAGPHPTHPHPARARPRRPASPRTAGPPHLLGHRTARNPSRQAHALCARSDNRSTV